MQLGALSYLHRNQLACVLHFYIIVLRTECQGCGSIGMVAINNALGPDPIGSTPANENAPFHAVMHYAANNFAYTGPVLRGGLFADYTVLLDLALL